MATMISAIHANWHHYFFGLSFSSDEFYTKIENILKTHEFPDIKIERVTFFQGNILSLRREYLRISRQKVIFDVCAAPYGKGFFVSWWFGEEVTGWDTFIAGIPILYFLFGPSRKTYYQMDTMAMFQDCVRNAVTQASDECAKSQNLRTLSDTERQYQQIPNKRNKLLSI